MRPAVGASALPACPASAVPLCVISLSSAAPARRRRRKSPPILAPRAPGCGPLCGPSLSPRPRPTAGSPDGASLHGNGDPAPCGRCVRRRRTPPCGAWHRSSCDPAPPAPGRPNPKPARHSRGPHRCRSGQAPHHRVCLHGGGRLAGRRRGAGPPGQRPGAALGPAARAHHGAGLPQPGRDVRGPTRDPDADCGGRHTRRSRRGAQRHRAALRLTVRAPPHPEGDARTRANTADSFFGGCGRAVGDG